MTTVRQERRERGGALQAKLFRPHAGVRDDCLDDAVPGFSALSEELVFGGIWSRAGLGERDRMICTLAALGALERLPQLRRCIPAALDVRLSPRSIGEILLQSGLYGGFPLTENTAAVAREVFAERGLRVDEDQDPAATSEELRRRGREMLRRLHGARGQEGYAAPENPVTGALYALAVEYGYGVL